LRRSRKIDVRIIEFDRQARKIAARVNSRVANRASELKSGAAVRNRDGHVERLNKGSPHVDVGASFLKAV